MNILLSSILINYGVRKTQYSKNDCLKFKILTIIFSFFLLFEVINMKAVKFRLCNKDEMVEMAYYSILLFYVKLKVWFESICNLSKYNISEERRNKNRKVC